MTLPGFVDIHCHGGGGGSFDTAEGIPLAIETHRRHGTTALMASLVTAPIAALEEQIQRLIPYVDSGELVGIHLEGPFLAPQRAGAQNRNALVHPNRDAVERLINVLNGRKAMITIAPELPGAIEAIRMFCDHGVVVALGHSQASWDQSKAAIDAGATVITHLFNGMPGIDHRNPGLIDAALLDDRVYVELILDGHHLSEQAVEIAMRLAPERWFAVTDAILATDMPDGDYSLGGLDVQVSNGIARLTDKGNLAGSTLTMDRAYSYLVERLGLTQEEAVEATSTRAAKALGLS